MNPNLVRPFSPVPRLLPVMSQYDLSMPPGFDGKVRLFPLPNLVMLPGVIQGLHIFESRYREMVADALQHDSLIAMAVLREPEGSSPGLPRLFPMVCVGRIVSHTQLEDGRYNLMLLGLRRAALITEFPPGDIPWRNAEIELVGDICLADSSAVQRARAELLDAFASYAQSAGINLDAFQSTEPDQIPVGILADTIAYTCQFEIESQLAVLGKIDVVERAILVTNLIREKVIFVQSVQDELPSSFPPQFSPN